MKEILKQSIKEYQNQLNNINVSFKDRDDTYLYNSTRDKLTQFLSIIDQIESKYYDKLLKNLENIKLDITKLSNAIQDD